MYDYRARVKDVVDGDTVDLEVKLGFYMKAEIRFRLAGINTPELHAKDPEERKKAVDAKMRVVSLFNAAGNEVIVRSTKTEKYGRWLAMILPADAATAKWPCHTLSECLLTEGLAKPYME